MSDTTFVCINLKSAEYFKRKFAKSSQVSRSASGSVQVCHKVANTNLKGSERDIG